jgi:hypothetical protein
VIDDHLHPVSRDPVVQFERQSGGFGDIRVGPLLRQFDFDIIRERVHPRDPFRDTFRPPLVAVAGYSSGQRHHSIFDHDSDIARVDIGISFEFALDVVAQFRIRISYCCLHRRGIVLCFR